MLLNWNPQTAYDRYFSSGTYKTRYPVCNQRSLETILHYSHQATRVLDFGCGNGRYTVPILEQTNAHVTACDISTTAIQHLQTRLNALDIHATERVNLVNGSMDALELNVTFDVAIAMFGVLSHIPTQQARLAILQHLKQRLQANQGTLIISVPNAMRRFFWEQCQTKLRHRSNAPDTPVLEPGDIWYRRTFSDQQDYEMYYHLYTVMSFQRDLITAGFTPLGIEPESIFPESTITRQWAYTQIDGWLTSWVPAWLGYGILAIAQA